MDVVCGNCSKKIKIPDEKMKKIPKGKSFVIACPKCKNKVTVKNGPAAPAEKKMPPKPAAKAPAPAKPEKTESPPAPPDENGGSPENPFDFLEEGAKTAILCEPDMKTRAKMKSTLESMEYHIAVPDTQRDALKQLRSHDFDVVGINERFGTRDPDMNHILKHLQQLNMSTRRNMFVLMISERYRTGDNMMAFNKSVNLIINIKDVDRVQSILERGVKDNDRFFHIYKDLLKQVKGR